MYCWLVIFYQPEVKRVFESIMGKFIKFFWNIILVIILTVISQVGGIIYLISIILSNKIRCRMPGKLVLVFTSLYLVSTFLIVPTISPWFGRQKIDNNSHLKPAGYITVLLNRNYVTSETNLFLQEVSNQLMYEKSEVQIRYLDACFPFIKGFPLLPHLSHNDGCKIDFSLVYEDENGTIVNLGKSVSGYGVFEEARKDEFNQCKDCLEKGYFQYDYPKYLTLGSINSDLRFSERGTKELIEAILINEKLSKLFIEPHLKQRLNLVDKRIRFHGCGAVRHDDHIHVQIR